MKRIRIGLKAKFIIVLTVLCLCVTLATSAAGIITYNDTIIKRYNHTAYQTAKAVSELFTGEELSYYADLTYRYNTGGADDAEIQTAKDSDRYKQVNALIDNLRKNMNANDINICVFNMDILGNFDEEAYNNYEWNPLYYITDSYHDRQQSMSLGDCGAIYPEYIGDIIASYKSGTHSDNYFVSQGQFGYTTSAVYPIVYNGSVIAFAAVEVPMSTLLGDLNAFVARIAVAAGITAAFILLIDIFIMVRTMISPIKTVAYEAEKFVANNNLISDRLKSIKTNDEIQTLSENILKLETDINIYIDDLTRVTAEKERISAELSIASQIQANMLPSTFPAFPDRKDFDIYATMRPAKEVGGDFYDFFLIDDTHLAMVMADVSGKGVPAALFMVIARTLIKNYAQISAGTHKYSPAGLLSYVNDRLCERNEAEQFVTVWLCIADLSNGHCVASNAGHEYPAIKRHGGRFEIYKTRNSPAVATMEGLKFREYEFDLAPGDTIFTYTDGVAEATDTDNNMFGLDNMLDALNTCPDASLETLLAAVKARLDDFVGDADQFDDITMLGFKYYGKDAE